LGPPVERYQQYLAARDAGYMQLETGVTEPRLKPDWAELSGYDRIALMTMRAIVRDQGAIIPLDVDEIKDPTRTIPRSIVLSTFLVAALYILMTVVILGMIPW